MKFHTFSDSEDLYEQNGCRVYKSNDPQYLSSQNIVSTMMTFKGLWKDAPEKGENLGDVYADNESDSVYIWTGSGWEDVGSKEPEKDMPTNCCNCGAPLRTGLHCEYCGTRNRRIGVHKHV